MLKPINVIPAKAGIQALAYQHVGIALDSCLRRNDDLFDFSHSRNPTFGLPAYRRRTGFTPLPE